VSTAAIWLRIRYSLKNGLIFGPQKELYRMAVIDYQVKAIILTLQLALLVIMTKYMYLVWLALAVVNIIFAVSGRGNLHYLVAALFIVAGIVAWRSQPKQ
jgi:hypothetical protein